MSPFLNATRTLNSAKLNEFFQWLQLRQASTNWNFCCCHFSIVEQCDPVWLTLALIAFHSTSNAWLYFIGHIPPEHSAVSNSPSPISESFIGFILVDNFSYCSAVICSLGACKNHDHCEAKMRLF